MGVDEARRHNLARHVAVPLRRRPGERAHRRDPVALDGQVPANPGVAGPIDEAAAGEQEIEHEKLLYTDVGAAATEAGGRLATCHNSGGVCYLSFANSASELPGDHSCARDEPDPYGDQWILGPQSDFLSSASDEFVSEQCRIRLMGNSIEVEVSDLGRHFSVRMVADLV